MKKRPQTFNQFIRNYSIPDFIRGDYEYYKQNQKIEL